MPFEALPKPKRGRPPGRTEETADLLYAAVNVLKVVQPTTVRGVCYQLFTQKLIPAMSVSSTNKVGKLLTSAREEGIAPWSWIVDDGRPIEPSSGWEDPADFIGSVSHWYSRDRWVDQPERVIVISEKGTVGGVIRSVTKRYNVPFAVYKGFGSATALHDLAELSIADPRPLTLIYVGDFDPSGRYMVEVDIPGRIEKYGGRATIETVAVTPAQIDGLALSTFPASEKRTDTRCPWFRENHGETCAELDALPAPELRSVVERAVLNHIDLDIWARSGSTEAAERAALADFFAEWPGAA